MSRAASVLLLLLLSLLACKKEQPVADADSIFTQELARRGIAYVLAEGGVYEVRTASRTLTVSLENIRRDFAREHDAAAVIRFVDRVLAADKEYSWNEVQGSIYFSAEAADHDFGDTLRKKISDEVERILVRTDPEEGKISWLAPADLSAWRVDRETVERVAAKNLDALLEGKKLEVEEVDGMRVGMVPVDSVFKASVIFAPSFKRFVSTELGWPVFVVIPCRDFIFVFGEKDRALLDRLGSVVQHEYRASSYPITTEVLRFSDTGIDAIGAFPK